jgi:sulfate/thiosulfate transport system substrate-binding protein
MPFRGAPFILAVALLLATMPPSLAQTTLLNVSYDPTREFYADVAKQFAAEWKKQNGESLTIRTSNNGSGASARAVMDGLGADVVTLAAAADIDAIANAGLVAKNWQDRLPDHSTPYISTIVFLVREGNPKRIHDWGDLIKPGVAVITPNPKTSGGGRWNYLAAWAYGRRAGGGDAKGRAFVAELLKHVSVLDTGAHGATITFAERGQGDVLIAWENEALLATKQMARSKLEIVRPSISILAEPAVAVVDKNVEKHKNAKQAEAFLRFLYTEAGQELAAKHFYRPRLASVAAKHGDQFPAIKFVTIADFGGWQTAQKTHFADGAVFDQLYTPVK